MRLFALIGVFLALLGHSQAQGRPVGDRGVVRVYVQHADPYAIKSLLEGLSFSKPELSTILGFAGVPDQESELIASIFGGQGTLVVNPTDNSILFFPKK